MKKVLFTLVLALGISQVYATEPVKENVETKTAKSLEFNHIEGKIIDHVTGEALVGVSLKLKGSNKKAYSDLNGVFSIKGVAPGTYDIDIKYVSYKTVTLKKVSATTPDVNLKVELESLASSL